jgi:hypothetical protein
MDKVPESHTQVRSHQEAHFTSTCKRLSNKGSWCKMGSAFQRQGGFPLLQVAEHSLDTLRSHLREFHHQWERLNSET